MPMPRKPIMIMAGGTGGHIFPALAVADYLRERGVPVIWLGSQNGMECRLVPVAGHPLVTISIAGLRGKSWRATMSAPVKLFIALVQAIMVMVKYRPGAVLGMGGFASGPGGLAAWLLRIPLIIHEQNAIPGMTNRLLSKLATTVMEAFPGTFGNSLHPVHAGNPVRRDILQLPPPITRLSAATDGLKLLVFGGSQGAAILNETVPQALASFAPGTISIHHQTGIKQEAAVRGQYQRLGIAAEVSAFVQDMASAYAWADLVVCRSGALTVAELAAAGLPAVLVPFPSAVDDHQTANARYLSQAGAAILLPQREFTADRLTQLLQNFITTRAQLLTMAEKARSLARPEATARVADACLEAANA